MAILVTGGAGYIGSVTTGLLIERGEQVVVLDDCLRGHARSLPAQATLVQGRVGDRPLVRTLIERHRIDACIHFAALAYVGESVENPALYLQNNVVEGFALLEELHAGGVRNVVFSSSCATYGQPDQVPIDEQQPQRPTSPYGWTKLMFEGALRSHAGVGLRSVALRYFNAAGATSEHGEDHDPETHLIPLALRAALGTGPVLKVMGTDYPTADGTAVRDYIHVADLASAHWLALQHLRAHVDSAGANPEFLNLGTGQGSSVLDVVRAVARVTGKEVPTVMHPRRAGDPAHLVARPDRAKVVLGWQPRHSSLDEIVGSAHAWSVNHPDGYGPG
jgi:UDP-glucose 4-epimerase